MRTSTFKDYRLNREYYFSGEIKALEVFNADYIDSMDYIVFGQKEGTSFEPKQFLTEREENIVLSVIQWLGTPVGQGFIDKLNK